MRSGKHIVILTPGFPAEEPERSCIPPLQDFLKAYSRLFPKDQISVISFQYPFTSTAYSWNNIRIYPCNGRNRHFMKPFIWTRAKMILNTIHKTQPIDVVHSFWLGECARVGAIWTKQEHIPHIVTLMGQDALEGNRYATYADKATLIALSRNHSETFRRNYSRTVQHIIPWGISADDIPPDDEKIYDIIGVGSFNAIKNYELFIRIIAEINQNQPVKALLIGSGQQEKKLKGLIRKSGLEQVIAVEGPLAREQVLKKMRQSRIFLHTSTYESFGNVFIEARACGNTIVSFNVGTASSGEYWHIASDPVDMKAILHRLLATRAIANAEILFHVNSTAKTYHEFYG